MLVAAGGLGGRVYAEFGRYMGVLKVGCSWAVGLDLARCNMLQLFLQAAHMS